MKDVSLSLFIETLTKASFDVESSGGHGDTAHKNVAVTSADKHHVVQKVDGKAFLEDLDIALRERALQAMIPYRYYHPLY